MPPASDSPQAPVNGDLAPTLQRPVPIFVFNAQGICFGGDFGQQGVHNDAAPPQVALVIGLIRFFDGNVPVCQIDPQKLTCISKVAHTYLISFDKQLSGIIHKFTIV
jgi:hypothetical protein